MPTLKQLDAAMLYANIMEEIKIRIAAIDAGTGGLLSLPATIVREHCFLQLRLICELVALGCLTAHGDIDAAQKRLRKEWAAEKICDELEKLHPDFFPQPVLQGRIGSGHHSLEAIKPHPFPKSEFLKIYGRCGDVLHRGNVKKLISQKSPIEVHYPDITALAQKVVNLLQVHIVVMLGGSTVFLCVLRNGNDNDRVQVVIAEHRSPP